MGGNGEPSMMSKAMKWGGMAFKFVTFFLGVWALHAVYAFGCVWADLTEESQIFTIQDADFWGPVTMLVPTNCTLFHHYEEMLRPRNSSDDDYYDSSSDVVTDLASLAAVLGDEEHDTEIEYNYFGMVKLNEKTRHKFINLVQLSDCGANISAPDASVLQQYFTAMWSASSSFGIDALHGSRFRFFWLYASVIFLFLFIDLLCTVAMTCFAEDIEQFFKEYAQGDGLAAKVLKMGFKVLYSSVMKILIGTFQTYVLSLFVTFDRGDHLIMSYMPGWALILYTLYLCFGAPCSQVAASMGGNVANGCAIFQCFACCCLAVPMSCWSYCYNIDFLLQAFFYHALTPIFDPKFPSMMQSLGALSKTYGCAHVCEICFPCVEAAAAREVEGEVGEPVYVISEPLLA